MVPSSYSRVLAALCVCLCASLYAQKPRKQTYVPMDYSTCGYHASETAIPDVRVAVSVAWQEGDCSPLIQQAIDQVARRPADAHGHRGAVLLGEGCFRLDSPLRISTSGIVLRGVSKRQTVLVKHGVDRGALIYVEGNTDLAPMPTPASTDTVRLAEGKVMAGSTRLPVEGRWTVGERILVVRPCTARWIASLGMNDFGGGLDYTGWKPTDIDIAWDRTITAVDGHTITLDAPITTTLSREYGGAYVVRHPPTAELTECGIENLTLSSEVNDWNPKDEDHCWDGIHISGVRDGWVRHVLFRHFAGSAVNLQKTTSRITVEDCMAEEPVSETGGWRRQVFLTRGQQTLFQRCVSCDGIHDFAAGFCAAGPNAFVQCESRRSLGFSGSIGSWAAGLLFDIVNIDGNDLRFANLEQFQFGTGWNTANSMLWQCTASTIECYSPDTDNRSSGHGCWGTLTGNGEWTSSNDHVQPRSLFYHQLQERLGRLPVDPRLLPLATNATSSPTPDQAMAMAQESLTQPRLTMEAWITRQEPAPLTLPATTFRHRHQAVDARPASSFAVDAGHIVADGQLVTGNEYAIPWWSGRVKDNFAATQAQPAITRFVPGREGTGWTDRLDSVVGFLSHHHYASLNHHYGLWYDLRRTDHERVRRADGDVWAPFYEQPFARSGQGEAWDGLSRYDLTRPNRWYWERLRSFADKSARQGMMLFCQHYFQHNILEAGAHWVDCPWRPVNNINATNFPEPVPFAGDKRIFMAEQFYNEQDTALQALHRHYIRLCLEQLKDQPNAVHSISAEYTGPLHFTRFWLKTVAEWEEETGRHPLVALSCTRDVQDSIMADPRLSAVVDIIDIRYWHYNTQGLWAPEGGRSMAPRQWMRQMKVGKTGFSEAYRAVRETRQAYPHVAVTFHSQQYPDYGWPILMAGGSLPNVPLLPHRSPLTDLLLKQIPLMTTVEEASGCVALGSPRHGYLVYATDSVLSLPIAEGRYTLYHVDRTTGDITLATEYQQVGTHYHRGDMKPNTIVWLKRRKSAE